MVMPYHLHMPSYFLETFTEYPYKKAWNIRVSRFSFNLSFYKSNFLFLYICTCLNNIYYIIA